MYYGSRSWRAGQHGFTPAGDPRNPEYVYLPSFRAWAKYLGNGRVELFGWGDYIRHLDEFPTEEQSLLTGKS